MAYKKSKEKQREHSIKSMKKAQAATDAKRAIKDLVLQYFRSCKCGETNGLIYFRGAKYCPVCLNADYNDPSVDSIADSMSMIGSPAARLVEEWI